MFEELKKASFKKCIFFAVFFILIGIAMVVLQAKNVFYVIFGYADFYEIEPDKLKSQLVKVDLDVNLGCYLSHYERNTKTNAKKTIDLFYVIPTGVFETENEDEYNFRFMSIKVSPSYEKRMDQMLEDWLNGVSSTPISFKGQIKKLENGDYYDFKKYIKDIGLTDENVEDFTLPYYIDCHANPLVEGGVFCLVFFGGIAFIIAGIYRFVKGKTGGFLKKLREDIQISGYPDSYVESDYASAQNITKADDIKMGRLMTYYHSGAEYRAIPHNKVMWAYQVTTTHKTNGVKTGTTYSVMYYIDGYKNSTTLGVSNEAAALEILRRLDATCPWIVVGFSDERKKLFNNNRAEFLQIRYNTVEHTPVEPSFDNADSQTAEPTMESADSQTGDTPTV